MINQHESNSNPLKKLWNFLKEDTWQSWLVSLILVILIIKLLIFPFLSFATGSSLPLVVVESCSMYHDSSFDTWWNSNEAKYQDFEINKENFSSFSLKNGINKGDIILVSGKNSYEIGDVVIFVANTKNPIIHRLIETGPYETQGDNNPTQLEIEKSIPEDRILGKAVTRIPLVGWIKLIFFELTKSKSQRGLC